MTDAPVTTAVVHAQADLASLRLPELQAIAASLGIGGTSKLRKGALVDLISETQTHSTDTEPGTDTDTSMDTAANTAAETSTATKVSTDSGTDTDAGAGTDAETPGLDTAAEQSVATGGASTTVPDVPTTDAPDG
ncbi:MAG: Rho termination factor N-terminal domain-containing protein, partial [Actinomycetota bacterium]|nr:Rho termination factor N-terminal domain-containing protein [Actinomycetota bacterium]